MEKLRGLKMVVRAADAGSFSKAARSLGVTPSAVSHAVADLEKQLRVSIFYRTTRQLRLTEDGQAIYGRGREILDRLNELESTVARPSERLRGTLRVGLSVSLSRIIVMPAIAQFSLRHPDLRLNMVVLTQPREMHAEGVDLMLRVGDPPESGLIARRIARIRYAVYAAPEYLDRAGTPAEPGDLLRHPCLVFRHTTGQLLDEWIFKRGGERKLVKITHPAIVSDDREGLHAAMVGGAGIGRIGAFDPNWIRSGRLRKILTDWSVLGGFPIHAIYRKTPRQAPKIVAFLDFARAAFAAFDPEELTLIHEKETLA